MAGRVGAGIGAELGAMRVTEQIDALEAVAVDSFKFLAVTRILACIIAHAAADGHHRLLRHLRRLCRRGLASAACRRSCISIALSRSSSFSDFIPATLKTAVFGLIIGTVASYLGFTTDARHRRCRPHVDAQRGAVVDPDHRHQRRARAADFFLPMVSPVRRPMRAGSDRCCEHVSKSFDGRKVLDDVTLDMRKGRPSACSVAAGPARVSR